MSKLSKQARIYAVVQQIPAGSVSTYGDIARLAGLPRHARLVGYALNALQEQTDIPWYRVVNSQGQLSLAKLSPSGPPSSANAYYKKVLNLALQDEFY